MTIDTGTYISGIGHGALIVWVLVGGLFLRADDPLPLETTEVSLLSGEEFAALTAPAKSPSVSSEEPVVTQPVVEEDAPRIKPNVDVVPETPKPAEVVQPDVENVPEQAEPDPFLQAEVSDEAPVVPTPPAEDFAALVPAIPDTAPKPAPAPRIAPTPAAPSAPDTEISDIVTPEIVRDEVSEKPAEEKPATAPEEAATEIVTEAEKPAAAPTATPRPKSRPRPPKAVAAAPPSEPKPDAIANAVAAAVADAAAAPVQPSGPPLSSGEKDALRVAVSRCWNLGSASSEALGTTVVLAVEMSRQGKPTKVSMLSSDGQNENATRIAFDAARRAVIRCGVSGYNLPSDKYSQWQNIEMTFNPEKMRIK